MEVPKDHKRILVEEQGGSTSKRMKPHFSAAKGLSDAQLPSPQISSQSDSYSTFSDGEEFEHSMPQSSPNLSPRLSPVAKVPHQSNPQIATQKTPNIITKHSKLFHNPELPPLHILLQQSIDVSNATQGDVSMRSQIKTKSSQNNMGAILLPDIWTLISEDKVPMPVLCSSSITAIHPDNEKLGAQFAFPQSKKKRRTKEQISKVEILPSPAETAKEKRMVSQGLFSVVWKQRLEYLEARLIKKGYDTETAGRYAVIMRLLCISIAELEEIKCEEEILEEVPERLDVEETQV